MLENFLRTHNKALLAARQAAGITTPIVSRSFIENDVRPAGGRSRR